MTHPQQDNPKGTKMTDKIGIDELIERLERCSPFGHSEPKKHRLVENETFEKTITALTDMKAREEIVRLIDELRKEEATSVCIVADNPDFDGPNNVIYLYDPVTDKDTPFYGDNVLDCLRKARQSKTNHKGDEL